MVGLYTALFGIKVGMDDFGNSYYQNRKKNKRWVIYNGIKETTKIPPEWHIWMHYTVNEIPQQKKLKKWQKKHTPNYTGTDFAYYPNVSKINGIFNEDF